MQIRTNSTFQICFRIFEKRILVCIRLYSSKLRNNCSWHQKNSALDFLSDMRIRHLTEDPHRQTDKSFFCIRRTHPVSHPLSLSSHLAIKKLLNFGHKVTTVLKSFTSWQLSVLNATLKIKKNCLLTSFDLIVYRHSNIQTVF